MRERYRTTKPKVCVERFRLVTEFYQNNPTMPPMLKRARNLLNLCEKMPVLVNEDELIVGELASTYRGSALFPEYAVGWLFDEIRSGEFLNRALDPYDMDQEDMDCVMQFEDFWAKNDLSRFTDDALPPEFHDIVGNGIVTFGDKAPGADPVASYSPTTTRPSARIVGREAEAQDEHRRASKGGCTAAVPSGSSSTRLTIVSTPPSRSPNATQPNAVGRRRECTDEVRRASCCRWRRDSTGSWRIRRAPSSRPSSACTSIRSCCLWTAISTALLSVASIDT